MSQALTPPAGPIALGLALVAFAIAGFAPGVLNDGDTFWHIRVGERMLADGQVLTVDPFSATRAGAPWQTSQWLAQILMALAFKAGGWAGLMALTGTAFAATAYGLARFTGRHLDGLALVLTCGAGLVMVAPSLLARPHLLALPLLVLWVSLLVRACEIGHRPSAWILPVMAAWANIHGSFLLGLALMALIGLEAVLGAGLRRMALIRGWAIMGLAAVLMCVIGPHGFDTLLFPLRLTATPELAGIGEWQRTELTEPSPFLVVLAATLYVLAARRVVVPLMRGVILVGLVVMALSAVRHQMILGLVAPILLAHPLAQALGGASPAPLRAMPFGVTVLAVVALAGLRLALPVTRVDGPTAPISALAAVPDAVRALPVLNDYAFGGYLIFAGLRPSIDSRAELHAGASLAAYSAQLRGDACALTRALADRNVGWTLFAAASPIVPMLDALPGWRRLHADPVAVVHVRDGSDPVAVACP